MPTQASNSAFQGVRLALCGLWLALTVALMALVVVYGLAQSERRLYASADSAQQTITLELARYQAQLRQLAVELAELAQESHEAVRERLSRYLVNDPNILQAALVQRVAEADIAQWTQQWGENVFPAAFDGANGRRLPLTAGRGAYYVVREAATAVALERPARGLEVASWPPLAMAWDALAATQTMQVSPRLVFPDVGPAIALLAPVPDTEAPLYAWLLLRPDGVLPQRVDPALTLLLRLSAYPPHETTGQLVRWPALQSSSWLEELWFPRIQVERLLGAEQQLLLRLQRQLGWRDLAWGWLGVLAAGALLLLGLLWQALDYWQQRDQLRPRQRQQQFYRVNYDAMTGLPNRHLLQAFLRQSCASARRRRTKLGVLFLDPIRFRVINTDYGREVGDRVLRCLANKLRHSVREDDIVARVDSDGFVVVLQNMHRRADVAMVAEKLYELSAQPIWVRDMKLELGLSIGIALYPDDASVPEKLLELAEHNMQVIQKGREKPIDLKSRQGSQSP